MAWHASISKSLMAVHFPSGFMHLTPQSPRLGLFVGLAVMPCSLSDVSYARCTLPWPAVASGDSCSSACPYGTISMVLFVLYKISVHCAVPYVPFVGPLPYSDLGFSPCAMSSNC